MNFEFEREEESGVRFGRTPENVKDKWKQLGGDNINYRKKGSWTLEEGLKLLNAVALASGLSLLKKSMQVILKYKEKSYEETSKRLSVTEDSIKVYDRKVQIEEIVPLIIKKKRCKKHLPNLEISWSTISDYMKTRSYDDIRNYW